MDRRRSTRMREARRHPPKKDGLYTALKLQILIVVVLLVLAYQFKGSDSYIEVRNNLLQMMETGQIPTMSEVVSGTVQEAKDFVNRFTEEVSGRVYDIGKEESNPFEQEVAEETLLSDYEHSGVVQVYDPEQSGQGGWNPIGEDTVLQIPKDATLAPVALTACPTLPVEGTITSLFGYREHPITGNPDFHMGLDIASKAGGEVLSALPGVVTEVGVSGIYGNYIIIEHSSGFKTKYSHCDEIVAGVDMRVRQGARIATVGSSGMSTGPHLHFDVIVGGKFCNPIWILEELKDYRYTKYTSNVTVEL